VSEARGAGVFGEPWAAVEGQARSRCADHEWLISLSETGQQPVLQGRARRAEACVNACAGIEDPAAAVAMLREVANESPEGIAADECGICWYCGVPTDAYSHQSAIEHAPNCLWARIRRALGMDVPPAAPAGPEWGKDGDDA
jgi:hypothetical protein